MTSAPATFVEFKTPLPPPVFTVTICLICPAVPSAIVKSLVPDAAVVYLVTGVVRPIA